MSETKTPETGCAPLGRPLAETVSLEVVWAAAYAASHYNLNTPKAAVEDADAAVDDLLAAFPRGGR